MKKITFVLSFLIIPLSFLFSQNISTNGWKFPNTGTARVFIVFAEAVGDPEYSTVNSNWPAGSMPINPDAYADVIYNSSNVNGYLTKYFDEMSFGANSGLDNYVVIGVSQI